MKKRKSLFSPLMLIFRTVTKKNKVIAVYLLVGVALLIGLAYLCVPLYRIFCQVTGFGGTPHKGI
jgi:cytochrome c oxidase assembly protein subunit 11